MKLKVTIGLVLATLLVVVANGSTAAQGTKAPESSNVVVLSSSNTLVLNSEVDGDSVGKVISEAKKLDSSLNGKFGSASKAPLYLILNTPGGSIQSGLELIEALNGLGRKVNTVTMFAASMGFQIAQNLDERLILKSGVLMSHHAAGGIQGQFGGSHPSQLDSRYQLWLDRIRELDEQTVKRTNGKQTYDSYIAQYDHEMWLTGTKSVEQGYADKVVTVKCDASLSGTTAHEIEYMGIPVSYELDNCPLNTSPLNIKIGKVSGPISAEYTRKIVNEFLVGFKQKAQNPIQMQF